MTAREEWKTAWHNVRQFRRCSWPGYQKRGVSYETSVAAGHLWVARETRRLTVVEALTLKRVGDYW